MHVPNIYHSFGPYLKTKTIMELQKLLERAIAGEHGDAVAVQFDCTFSGSEDLDDQNSAALDYAADFIKDCINSSESIFTESALSEMQEYVDRVDDYLKEAQA